MSDKKFIIFAVILALALGIGGWIYSKNKQNPGPAAISGNGEVKTAGISFGDAKAPVLIEEYTNFLCPACATFAIETLPQIEENYIKTGKARIVFFIYPPIELSRAAFCVSKTDKFIEYHNYLFKNQTNIKQESNIFDAIKDLGINSDQFNECYNSKEAEEVAKNWLSEGQKRGVEATPTFFINGEKFVGAQPYADFENIIEQKLK